jgi:hypothetical protein
MKVFLPLAVMLFASSALADDAKPLQNKTGFQLRAESTGTQTKVGDAPERGSQAFTLRTARMILSGDVTESVSYTIRLDVKNALYEKACVGADTSICALDRAYLEHRLAEGLALRLGRLPESALSIENDYSSMDRYYESLITTQVAYQYLPLTTGASLAYTVAAQTFSVELFNGFTDTTTGAAVGKQKGENTSLAVAYRGNLAGGLLKPIVSYDRISRVRNGAEGTAARDQKVNFTAIGAGTQISAAGADVDVEFDQFTKPKFDYYALDAATSAVAKKTALDTKLSSVIAQVAYNIKPVGVRPFLKFSQDNEKTDGKDSKKYKRGNVGVEFRPTPKPFRYHAVIVQKNDGDIAGGKTVTTKTTQYIVGVAAKL